MATVSDIPSCTMDEFSQCEQSAFDDSNPNSDGCDPATKSSTFWETLFTLYLPVSALWIRRSMFGITMLVRTVILGHLLRLVSGNVSEWINEKTPAWLQSLLQPMVSHGKLNTKAWPPPALTALAMLTIFTLVVHPDGFTWIMLRKAKNGIISVLQSMSECWQVVITGYGVIPTLVASATIATLIFLMFALLRSAISPRQFRRTAPLPEKKKKKRKGQARNRSSTWKIRSQSSLTSPTSKQTSTASIDTSSPPSSPIRSAAESAPDLTPLTPNSSANQRSLSASSQKVVDRALDDLPEASTGALPPLTCQPKLAEKELMGRSRVPSAATVDTTAMSDDQSCGSTSIRSFPPGSVCSGSSKTSKLASMEQGTAIAHVATPVNNATRHKSKPVSTDSRRSKRSANTGRPKLNKSTNAKLNHIVNTSKSDGPSRWDVLKPGHTSNHPLRSERQSHSANSTNEHDRHQHKSGNPHRSSTRRAGRGAGGPVRRGRNNNTFQRHSTNPNAAATPTHGSNPATERLPVSPPVTVKGVVDNPSASVSKSLPPPPPGISRLPTSLVYGGHGESNRAFPIQKADSDTTLLFPVMEAGSTVAHSWDTPKELPHDHAYVSSSFLNSSENSNDKNWDEAIAFVSSPARFAANPCFPGSPSERLRFPRTGTVKENPFAPDSVNANGDLEKQIEADLQELGGQMAGSILDF